MLLNFQSLHNDYAWYCNYFDAGCLTNRPFPGLLVFYMAGFFIALCLTAAGESLRKLTIEYNIRLGQKNKSVDKMGSSNHIHFTWKTLTVMQIKTLSVSYQL